MSRERLYSPGPTGIRETQRFWIEPGEDQELLIGQGERTLLALRHSIADNIYCLLHQNIIGKAFHDEEFNCHATAAIALGESTEICWGDTKPRGEKMNVQEALATVSLPCGMQIYGYQWEGILHSAVLLGPSVDATPLAFHKNGAYPMELCPLENILSYYRYSRDNLTFYEVPHRRPGKLRRFLQRLFRAFPT